MKHIYLNLKRFDIPRQYGGGNDIADVKNWGPYIVEQTQEELKEYGADQAEFRKPVSWAQPTSVWPRSSASSASSA